MITIENKIAHYLNTKIHKDKFRNMVTTMGDGYEQLKFIKWIQQNFKIITVDKNNVYDEETHDDTLQEVLNTPIEDPRIMATEEKMDTTDKQDETKTCVNCVHKDLALVRPPCVECRGFNKFHNGG